MPAERGYIVRSGTSATNTTGVALVAATAKTVVAILGSSADTVCVEEITVSFASATATDAPATVELGRITALGTMTAFTPVQSYGPTMATSATAGYNATVEPTYSGIGRACYVPVFNGLLILQFPLGREPAALAGSQGFAIRVTSPVAATCLAQIVYAE